MLRISLSFLYVSILAAWIHASGQAPQEERILSTPAEIANDLQRVPCKRNERLTAARALFEQLGTPASEITTQKFRGAENLVVERPGRTQEKIVIGAHYDFTDEGCGAIDNWSGIVALAHVYRSIRVAGQQKSVIVVAFDNEERGLVGSRAMANAIPKEELPRYCAMINIDSFGLATPFALTNISSPALMKVTADAAGVIQLPFYTTAITGANSDSSAFLEKKIPAVTLSGLSNDWPSVLHSKNDQKERVNATSVYLGYRLALAVWDSVDRSTCDAFREGSKTTK